MSADLSMAIILKGSEPDNIKKRMNILFSKLDEAYPNKVIISLQKDHKKWAETVTGLYRLLGYPNGTAFLEAYGYTVQRKESGRPKTNDAAVIAELKERYPGGMPFSKVSEIIAENPDMKAVIKTMQNNADKLYGMGLKEYFQHIGLFAPDDKKSQLDDLITQLKQRYPAGAVLPKTVAKLKDDNSDLPVNRLIYSKEIYDLDVRSYLAKEGLLAVLEKPEQLVTRDTEEERCEAYLRLLAQRYEGKNILPLNVTELAHANPDIPVRKLNKYIRSKGEQKVERYYIRNRIMQEKRNVLMASSSFCSLTVKLKNRKTIVWTGEEGSSPFFQVPPRAREMLAEINTIDDLSEFFIKCASVYEDPEFAQEQYLELCEEFDAKLRSIDSIEAVAGILLAWGEFDPEDGLPPEVGCEGESLEYDFDSKECKINDAPDEEFVDDMINAFGGTFDYDSMEDIL